MLDINWNDVKGWSEPVISEYKNLSISPASSSLHYGIQCFEGMKAYKDKNGQVRLFRPDMNMNRLDSSMQRLSMPPLDKEGFLNCIKKLVKLDSKWVPSEEGYSLYIRPTAVGTTVIAASFLPIPLKPILAGIPWSLRGHGVRSGGMEI